MSNWDDFSGPLPPINTKNLTPKWTRLCWWLSRKLGGRKVFGKWDLT